MVPQSGNIGQNRGRGQQSTYKILNSPQADDYFLHCGFNMYNFIYKEVHFMKSDVYGYMIQIMGQNWYKEGCLYFNPIQHD